MIRYLSFTRQLRWILSLAALLIAASTTSFAQENGKFPIPQFRKIVVNFTPYLDTSDDESARTRAPFAGQVVFAVIGDKLFVTIAELSAGAEQAVSPNWLQVNTENGELLKVEQIANELSKTVGKTTGGKLSLSITTPGATPGAEGLTAQISITEPAATRISAPPATSRLRLRFFRNGNLIASDESIPALDRDSWTRYLLSPGQTPGTDKSRGRCGWLRAGNDWVFVFPAGAPGVNTNLYVFPQPDSPQPIIANTDSTTTPSPTSAAARHDDEKEKALRAAKTICVRSRSDFFTREAMERELLKRPEFSQWGMMITRQEESADLIIEVHRKRFSTLFTFSALDPRSGQILASDTASSIGGTIEPKLAARFINMVKTVRQ